ncbi:unnamed protein product, partial [Iphiclides podalirius]
MGPVVLESICSMQWTRGEDVECSSTGFRLDAHTTTRLRLDSGDVVDTRKSVAQVRRARSVVASFLINRVAARDIPIKLAKSETG